MNRTWIIVLVALAGVGVVLVVAAKMGAFAGAVQPKRTTLDEVDSAMASLDAAGASTG